ncbi:hypothetical protein SDC9_196391 [bioreactor metagenome]|uniref:Uncharacterized protein n=1 Tax=bioreactor metagenome TaxID=1076179 RepID=A0A645IEA5_9ZZZZ
MMNALDKSLGGVFTFSGFAEKRLHNLFAVTTVSDEERRQMLDEIRNLIRSFI